LNIKKTVVAIVLVAIGARLALAASSDTGFKDILNRLAEDKKLMAAGLSIELGSDAAKDVSKTKSLTGRTGQTGNAESQTTLPPFPSDVVITDTENTEDNKEQNKTEPEKQTAILPTTIEGGMVIKNETSYQLDLNSLVSAGTSVTLASDGPQILIIHTHGSEAYTPDGINSYSPSDNFRTEDKQYSVIRVGDELTSCLASYGLRVLHDRNIYDYPSYTGSYAKSGDAIEKYLKQYPSISVVLDVHRDSIGNGDAVYKTIAEAKGEPCSQIMLLAGTGENGLAHPKWEDNLKFALYLQSAIVKKYPTLARPIALEKERYNQQLTTGSLILEVGSSGNTLNEALNAVRLFADAVVPALEERCAQNKP